MQDSKLCLGIESTAHTFGAGIVDSNGKILSDERMMYKPEPGEGIVPRIAAEHHMTNAKSIISKALEKSKINIKDIDVIAYSQGPGLPPCLNVGAAIARFLSVSNKKNLVGVNHSIGHIEIGKLTTKVIDPVVLYLSGGNTQIIAFVENFYRIFGQTQDIAVGNAFDAVARVLGLNSPGGPEIEKLAKIGSYVELPYAVKGMDVSFSGIVTEICRNFEMFSKNDICYSLQETCFSMLVEVAERAIAHTGKEEVLMVGGVAANKRMQDMLETMCRERGCKMAVVDNKYSGDNGSMIAWGGILEYLSGKKTVHSQPIKPKWKVDQVEIGWMSH